MTKSRIALALTVLLLAATASPAMAYEWLRYPHSPQWHVVHRGIYELNNRIAFLEANPDIDEGYKGPIIRRSRADILRLRAALYPADWRWATPCCYGRRPIRIR